MSPDPNIAVIGLGYVGLPLAVALARHFDVLGFDIDAGRIDELKSGHDRTGEIEDADLGDSALELTSRADDMNGCDLFIVTVPTPVDAHAKPDLSALTAASELVGSYLRTGGVVVIESTVYPGVTEEHCGPILERVSGLSSGRDFFLGYSPERINPGDKEHTVDRIKKIVAGQTQEITDMLADIYARVTTGGIHIAPNIKTAEAAKAIENAQRDINIAFINEVSMILGDLGLNALDVLEAAETKWNFLPFRPGLVGGHCIGVDPYYLAHVAEQAGRHPEIVLAGRKINDAMGAYIANSIWRRLDKHRLDNRAARILVLGLTFKEDVADLRNSKIIDIIDTLKAKGAEIAVHDAMADRAQARSMLGFDLVADLAEASPYDAVIGAVQHRAYLSFDAQDLLSLVGEKGLVADVKGMWRDIDLPSGIERWQL
ncbi:MAG: nucleotide sugar dehydrogenase [Alphaproteobacteria bacterium]|nr:nucleotide sugar dehydrogenase [Alphaproteobacteria bacterium]